MMFQLIVTAGPDKGRTFTLQPGAKLSLGRSRSAAGRLSDPAVSRLHCEIEVEGEQTQLANRSDKGTLVNGEPVDECVLRPGDLVRIGATELRFAVDPSEASTQAPPAPPVSPEALVGRTLAHYEIESILARGDSSVVFKARDTDDDQTVALKVLRPESARNPEAKRRFVRAMKTMLPVRHPNLVAVYAAGKTKSFCWTAMEYVEGESLTAVIKRLGVAGALDWRHAYRVAGDIARALEHAHGLGILHRNVTPRNILIRSSDKSAVLGDLMLAKALEGTLAEQVTEPGALLGDVAYLAPERTYPDAKVDARADLYGLGATLYALLTGRPPFVAARPVDLVIQVRTAAVVPPKKSQLSIPDLFEGIVLKLLAKQPEDRHQSATELLANLRQLGKFTGMAGA
jgi:serine/threonine protein kinase